MSDTLYERYTTGDDQSASTYSSKYRGNSFTIGNTGTNERHNITSIKCLMYRHGSPGTVTLEVKATDGDGKPTDIVLTSGTLNGNDFTDDFAGLWYEFTLTPYALSANTKYAFYLYAAGGSKDNKVELRYDTSSPSYTGGEYTNSNDAGSTWGTYATDETLFEEYGIAAPIEGQFLQPTKYW